VWLSWLPSFIDFLYNGVSLVLALIVPPDKMFRRGCGLRLVPRLVLAEPQAVADFSELGCGVVRLLAVSYQVENVGYIYFYLIG